MPRFVRGASLASLTIAFGLVTISVRPYSVTKRSTALWLRWMKAEGDAVRQWLVPSDELIRRHATACGGRHARMRA